MNQKKREARHCVNLTKAVAKDIQSEIDLCFKTEKPALSSMTRTLVHEALEARRKKRANAAPKDN